MRKIHVIILLILLIIGVTLFFGTRYGLRIGNVYIAPGKEKMILEDLSQRFWEDIQFKDFDAASAYHEPEIRKEVDIPYLMERLFLIKPEQLDVRSIEIQEVDIDSTELRGRVRTKLMVRVLNTGQTKHPEVILYWYKKNDSWFMKLESSLRPPEKRKK